MGGRRHQLPSLHFRKLCWHAVSCEPEPGVAVARPDYPFLAATVLREFAPSPSGSYLVSSGSSTFLAPGISLPLASTIALRPATLAIWGGGCPPRASVVFVAPEITSPSSSTIVRRGVGPPPPATNSGE